jgi:hypothetical protein
MIGTRIQGTLWTVTTRYREKPDGEHRIDQRVIMTADPSGADLLDVARLLVLGDKAKAAELDFALMQSQRLNDRVEGLALVQSDQTARSKLALVAPLQPATTGSAEQ